MRLKVLVAAFMALGAQSWAPAHAALNGDNVSVIYWTPYPGNVLPGATPAPCDPTTMVYCEIEDHTDSMGNITNAPPYALIPAHFPNAGQANTTIDIGDISNYTEVAMTYKGDLAWCATGVLPCSDVFNGFEFSFIAGAGQPAVDISKVTVKSEDTGMVPADIIVYPTYVYVNLVGNPEIENSKLVLDVYTAGSGPPPVPETSTWAMMLLGFAGLGFTAFRRNRATPQIG